MSAFANEFNCSLKVASYETEFPNGNIISTPFVNTMILKDLKASSLEHCVKQADFLCRWSPFQGVTKNGHEARSLYFKKVQVRFYLADGLMEERVIIKETHSCKMQKP